MSLGNSEYLYIHYYFKQARRYGCNEATCFTVCLNSAFMWQDAGKGADKGAEKEPTKDAEKTVAEKAELKSDKTEKQKVCLPYIWIVSIKSNHKSFSVSVVIISLWLVSADYTWNINIWFKTFKVC